MIPNPLLSIANHLWQSTFFAAAAGLLTLALRKNRAQARYWLWFSASVKFFIPFSLLIALGGQFGPHNTAAARSPSLSYAMAQVSQPFVVSAPRALITPPAPSAPVAWIPAALGAIWAIGFAIVFLSWWRRWRELRAALRSATPLDLPIAIKAMTSPAFAEPGIFGVWRAVLLLPAGITEVLSLAQLEAIVAHELCHVRRRDNLATAIHMAVEAVFWFHPLVWWLGARLMEERERACDEEVLLLGREPEVYGGAILKICELYLESRLPCVAGVTGANLKKRIEKIMSKNTGLKLSFAKKAALAVAGAAAVITPIATGILNAPVTHAQPAPATTAKFERASVKACAGGTPGGSPVVSPGSLNTGCITLAAQFPMAGLIQRAYGRLDLGHVVSPGSAMPILGGPGWIYSAHFVIDAKAADSPSRETMEGPMLQALLEDRFGLKIRRETRVVPVIVLTVAQAGKLLRATEGICVPRDYSNPRQPLPPGKRYCNDLIGRKGPNTTLNVENATIDSFSKLLAIALDRPVIDKSGLLGKYNFHLEFATDPAMSGVGGLPGLASNEPATASILTIAREQLGLKLESTQGPREFLVIDHLEKPSPN